MDGTSELSAVMQDILANRGLPRSLRETIESQLRATAEESKLPVLISVLDEASANPNLSPFARTQIWSMLSTLEGMKR